MAGPRCSVGTSLVRALAEVVRKGSDTGSRVKREFHARFCERPQGQILRPTHQRAQALITYPNFWKQFYRKFPQYREATVTAREFEPGE